MNYAILAAAVLFTVLAIVLIVREDWREKIKDWYPGLLLLAGGLLAFLATRKQKPGRDLIPTIPNPPTELEKGAYENDNYEELKAKIQDAKRVNSGDLDDIAERLRIRAERIESEG